MSDRARDDRNSRRRKFYRVRTDWERHSDGYPLADALDALGYSHTPDGVKALCALDAWSLTHGERGKVIALPLKDRYALLDALAKTCTVSDDEYPDEDDMEAMEAWEERVERGIGLTALAAAGMSDNNLRQRIASALHTDDPNNPILRDPEWVREERYAILALHDTMRSVPRTDELRFSDRLWTLRGMTKDPDCADAVERVRRTAGLSTYAVDAKQVCELLDSWDDPDTRRVGVDMLDKIQERAIRCGMLREPEDLNAMKALPARLIAGSASSFPRHAVRAISREGVVPYVALMDTYGDAAVVSSFRAETDGWSAAKRDRSLGMVTDWSAAGVDTDSGWTYAVALDGTGTPVVPYTERVPALHGRVPSALVPSLASRVGEPVSDLLDSVETFRTMNAGGGFPFPLAAAGLGVPEDLLSDVEWNAWCAS